MPIYQINKVGLKEDTGKFVTKPVLLIDTLVPFSLSQSLPKEWKVARCMDKAC